MTDPPIIGDRHFLNTFVPVIEAVHFTNVICNIRIWLDRYTITEESISLHAPFQRTLTLRYEDMRYLGVSRSPLSYGMTCWLSLSHDPVRFCAVEGHAQVPADQALTAHRLQQEGL